MVITNKTTLPTEEELTVQELNVGFPVLQAAAFHMGKYCEWYNNEFILCRNETKDPRQCIKEGKDVTACSLEFFRKVKKSCYDEFTQYYKCIDAAGGVGDFEPCRKTQAVFDKCALDKLNIERPTFGYYCEVKIHDTKRPKPETEKRIEYSDPTPRLPPNEPMPKARFGARSYWDM